MIEKIHTLTDHVDELYKNWFLDYASYVILERAIPLLTDGLKPVQRRILHAMKKMHDGRYHKVANIIGQTMQYHPHGDASIGDALVNLGQKGLLIDTQGNWGDIRTGDCAAAPRYIEGKLSQFALDILFYDENTQWQESYDGRNQEPIALPVKFPLLLAQGVEGIAVGLSTKILPHNFLELIDASIAILENREFKLYPDFPTGGLADVREYNDGIRGSRILSRAKMEIVDSKTIRITEIPYGVSTESLIESIIKANDLGKIKIKKITDRTARDIDICIELYPDTNPNITIDALYALTDCQISISPICCVIQDSKPQFFSISEILKINTMQTKSLLQKELQFELENLEKKKFSLQLEQIFISKKIYQFIEKCTSWEEVLETVMQKLQSAVKKLDRNITQEDITALTELKFKQIAKYNAEQSQKNIDKLTEEIKKIKNNIEHITEYTINYYKRLREKYGTGHERRTKLTNFETIQATDVVANNQKLYVNRQEGFVGYGLKKDEFVTDCSDLDDVIVFLKNGTFKVVKISDKIFVGKDIIYVSIWKKNDEKTIYNMIYQDSTDNLARVKRFNVTSIIHDKEYNLAPKCTSPKVLYLTANPNGETEVVTIHFHPLCKAKNKTIDYNFVDIDVKKKESQGNILCKYPIMRITHKIDNPMIQTGTSVWYDPTTGRLNSEQHGEYLGSFLDDDSILVLYDTGYYQITTWNFSNHYDMEHIKIITKYNSETVITAIYLETAKNKYYLKRFQIDTTKLDEKFDFLPEENAKLIHITIEDDPYIKITTQRKRPERNQVDLLQLSSLIAVKGRKAQGNMLSNFPIIKIEPCQAPDHSNTEETNTTNNNNDSKTHDKKSNKTKTSQYMEDLFFID